MQKRILIIWLIFIAISGKAFSAIFLDVRIYSMVDIQKTDIVIFSGKYELKDAQNNVICELYKNSTLTILSKDSKVEIYQDSKLLTKSESFFLKGTGFINTLKVLPVQPAYAIRVYDDNMYLKPKGKNIILINNVELEHYVAGVVESEGGGSTKDIEFFLVQSVACRTYALANVRKHWNDGYHLCDDVHCQVYKGRSTISYVMMAASQTAGQVIVDKNNKMISAAFHSNSGGQTMNSEDVWSLQTSYLKSVVDTFSLSMRGAKWQTKMTVNEWLKYLKDKYNYPVDDPDKKALVLNFVQPERKVYLTDKIALKDIRKDLNLRSTFFSITQKGDSLIFDGKGYGHGVGLSQEGAIRMIQLGYSYKDVIHFYYKDVQLKNFEELDYFFINYNY